MKLTTKLHLVLALAAGMFTTSAIAGPGGHSPNDFPRKVTTKEGKTLDVKDGEKEKKGILAWFAPDSKHDCSGCGGKVTVTTTGGGKGPTLSQYKHTCSKCGPDSAYVCTDHKKA
jgi:hypothetical protein